MNARTLTIEQMCELMRRGMRDPSKLTEFCFVMRAAREHAYTRGDFVLGYEFDQTLHAMRDALWNHYRREQA